MVQQKYLIIILVIFLTGVFVGVLLSKLENSNNIKRKEIINLTILSPYHELYLMQVYNTGDFEISIGTQSSADDIITKGLEDISEEPYSGIQEYSVANNNKIAFGDIFITAKGHLSDIDLDYINKHIKNLDSQNIELSKFWAYDTSIIFLNTNKTSCRTTYSIKYNRVDETDNIGDARLLIPKLLEISPIKVKDIMNEPWS